MNESFEFPPAPTTPPADTSRLERQVAELQGMVRLILLGLIITTGGLCLFMYRQTKLLRYQVIAQGDIVAKAEESVAPLLQMIPRLQGVGWTHPDYASNVLSQFALQARQPTNAAAPPK